MESVIDRYKDVVVQIGTPYSVGTGFYLKRENLIVTNEHVIRDNREVTVNGRHFDKQTVPVLYIDPHYDLAFLSPPNILPEREQIQAAELCPEVEVRQGEVVVAVGHPFGYDYTATQGIVSNPGHYEREIRFIQHDAALNPGNSGGPLINDRGQVIGVNNFIVKDGNSVGFSLPAEYLHHAIHEFKGRSEGTATRCLSCANLVSDHEHQEDYCPHCGSQIVLPSRIKDYEPTGVAHTIESFIGFIGHDVKLCRMGPQHWIIKEGSASIRISYNERSGMIFGDAYLCQLPKKNIGAVYQYLLRENTELEGMSFSVPANSREIVLSLFIYDRYLNEHTGRELFYNLFKKADHYDNILIEEYGAVPKENWNGL
jgi:serine protease Do